AAEPTRPHPLRATASDATEAATTTAAEARRPRPSDALEDGAGAETAAAAHRDQGIGAVRSLELADGLRDEEGAGCAERVTQRDRAAVRVGRGRVAPELAHPGERDRRERFVDLG